MNPSTAQAMVIADELARNDVRHVVVCPGSRNAPLSMALVDAAAEGKLRLHVRVDERSAGFLAMGLAVATGRPAAVVCTSGTAVANLHPAVLESYHAGVGLIVISADRPPELHGSGANQTIDQRNLFAPAAILVDFPVAERRTGQNPVWRGLVCRAVAQAESGRPVQINVPFREPLVPTFGPAWPEELTGRPGYERWTTSAPPRSVASSRVDFPLPARTLMVVGSGRPDRAAAACEVATRAGWPIIAEPVATTGGASVLRCGPLLLASLDKAEDLRPDAVVVVGRPTLSRGVRGLMGRAPVYGIGDHPQWTDPQYVAIHVRGWLDTTDLSHVQGHDPEWLTAWRTAAERASTAVDKLLEEDEWPSGLRVARDVVAALPSGAMLFLGSSNPVRDVDLVAETRTDLAIHANRGVAGIDGNVSAAIGVTLGEPDRPGYALLGDLTFLHDSNGLLIGPDEARPDLTIVVLNDDGGGIFSLLEQGAAEHKNSFERVFGTPHGTDLAALCAGYRVPHVVAESPEQLREALRPRPGLRVVEIRADRARLRDLHARLRTAVSDAAFG
ncbi:2-succinyl-5-enolpyruvyl-6-hydroxy-3-cyclohexene-1-carboxylic-acid synthase [Kibdelosporangium persicum]|uniref:2-succinyl-5-enolpyruvyl-6-hydroxy-3-cyclohexene-1-carboxylate synthase n=1 Tax=Kibdelosporangium persicum TaxID=2698649 RepID=A0ABX2FB27_9PSEU|nr:2-succinyl-5-enolpyruvyl-6-hydroxy-3-cyclohexene-1-carboxylic-acid synthase [Kibdelosporangium persicum]NRN68569.1 2-succinyl-5-enolpyruvyl-6-hydroxy-3-cyclohexene-1-carboxylic-acid synthase [Kibdelosporangium persicum]